MTNADIINNNSVEQATHSLICRHCVGTGRCYDYAMKCLPIGEPKNGKQKVLVFGDRMWANRYHIKKIQYVDPSRIHPLQ